MGNGLSGLVLLDGLRLAENVFRDKDCSEFIGYLDDLFVVLFDVDVRRRNCLILFDYLRGFGVDEIGKRYGCSIEEVECVLYGIEKFLNNNWFYYCCLSNRFSKEFTDDDILYGNGYVKESSYDRKQRKLRLLENLGGLFQDDDFVYNKFLVYNCGDLEFSKFIDDFLSILKKNLKPKHFAIFEMYINGNSTIDIAKFYCISRQRIHKILKEVISKVKVLAKEYAYYDLYDVYQSDMKRYYYNKYNCDSDIWR